MISKEKGIKSVWVLGSTSKVAQSICLELAKNGCKKFFLLSRNKVKSKEFSTHLKLEYDVVVEEKYLDLEKVQINEGQKSLLVSDFDLYLITAGYLGDNELAKGDFYEAKRIIDINFTSIIAWINAITTNERLNKKMGLWIFTSVAADRGRPSNYFYGAAKSGLKVFAEGLISRCCNKKFSVRVINAGFMDTPMTYGKAPKILCMKTSNVAKILLKRPYKRGIEYMPWFWKPIMILIKILPNKIVSKL